MSTQQAQTKITATEATRGQHVKTGTGKVHLVMNRNANGAYPWCSANIRSGVAVDAPVTCKTCAKHEAI